MTPLAGATPKEFINPGQRRIIVVAPAVGQAPVLEIGTASSKIPPSARCALDHAV
jgi:hypothetical protein